MNLSSFVQTSSIGCMDKILRSHRAVLDHTVGDGSQNWIPIETQQD